MILPKKVLFVFVTKEMKLSGLQVGRDGVFNYLFRVACFTWAHLMPSKVGQLVFLGGAPKQCFEPGLVDLHWFGGVSRNGVNRYALQHACKKPSPGVENGTYICFFALIVSGGLWNSFSMGS